jgi:hypothetical protein
MKPDRFIHIRAKYVASMPVDKEPVTFVTKPENDFVTGFETKTSTNSRTFEPCNTVTFVTRENIQAPRKSVQRTLLLCRSFAKQDDGTPKSEDTEKKKSAHDSFPGEHPKTHVTFVTNVTGGDPEGGEAAETTTERIARLDRERNERDRLAKRGYDYDGYGDQSYQLTLVANS